MSRIGPILNPGRACLECRRLKTKCDGVHPNCERCTRLGRKCIFDQVDRRPQLDVLEDKLQQLERELSVWGTRPSALSHPLFDGISQENSDPRSPICPLPAKFPIYRGPLVSASEQSPLTGVSESRFEEGYASLVPRGVIEEALSKWNYDMEVTHELRDYLVRIFIPYRNSFLFHVPQIPEFLSKIHLPPTHPDAIHPCLLNAVYLSACSVGRGYLSNFEPVFLSRTRNFIEQSLAYADRLMDMMWASVILSCYFTRVDRIVEAYNSTSTTVMFAVGCGLQWPSSRSGFSSLDPTSPLSPSQTHERTRLWYSLCSSDTSTMIGFGLPSSLPEEHVGSFHSMFLGAGTDPVYRDDVYYKAKSIALLKGVRTFVTSFKESKMLPDASFWEKFKVLSDAISELKDTLPPVNDPRGVLPFETFSMVNPTLQHAFFGSQVSTILLFNILSQKDERAYKRVLDAAYSMANLVKYIRGSSTWSPIHAPISVLVQVHTACEVVVREVHRCRASSTTEDANRLNEAEQMMIILFDGLLDLTRFFPVWGFRFRNLHALLLGNGEYATI